MNMPEHEFSPLESLQLIRSMIDKTKEVMYDKSAYFLLWGWGTFVASLAQFILKVVYNYPYHYRVWILVFVYYFISRIMSRRQKKTQQTETYVRESVKFLWIGISISFFVSYSIFSKIGWQYCYPIYMLLYGLGGFVTGKYLKFKPLIYGGLISSLLGGVSVWFDFDYQMLFACGALLASYIIPGHMLRSEFQKSKKQMPSIN